MVTGAIIQQAQENTEWHQSQIQGFYYQAQTSDRHQHVVRDVSRKDDSWLWSKDGCRAEYYATHAAMMAKIKQMRADILAAEINALMSAQ